MSKYAEQISTAGAAEALVKKAGELYLDGLDNLAAECLKLAVDKAYEFLVTYDSGSGEGNRSDAVRMRGIMEYKERVERLETGRTIDEVRHMIRG